MAGPTCLDDDVVGAYLEGALAEREAQDVELHLDACEACRKHVSSLARLPRSILGRPDRTLASTRRGDADAGAAGPLDQAVLAGTRIGRFVVQRVLGAGGMGVVFVAHDPELDRSVALKVLHPELWRGAGTEGRARLRREAQAMARLAHPNIVSVFDVATHGDQLVLTMEYVDGVTLDAWCRDERPPWREVLAACLAAGRGLAAAHAGGVIHRDFKPQNVLRGRDGRILVTDFGLARAGDAPVREARDPEVAAPAEAALALTRTGTVMGTPAYMAPEQFAGRPADAKTDQWNYCATVYRLLYGVPAFPGTTFAELERAVGGRPDDPPLGTSIPAHTRRVLLRGLRVDPAARHASMSELIAALGRDPARTRRARLLGGGAAVVAVGLATALVLRGGERAVTCDGGAARLAGIWDPARAQAVRAAFLATAKPYAAQTFARVEALLDRHAGALVATHQETCEATHVRGEQSPALLDLRMACLDRRLGELDALVDLFVAQTDAAVLDRSIHAAAALTPVSECAHTKSLLATAASPRDPVIVARRDAVNRELDRVDALHRAGKYRDGLAAVEVVMTEAHALGMPLLLVRALGLRGILHSALGDDAAAERDFQAALIPATQGGDDRAVAKIWSNLITSVGIKQARLGEGRLAAAAAEAALARLGGDPTVHALVLTNLAAVLVRSGQYAEALAYSMRALPLLEAAHGPTHPEFAFGLAAIGGTHLSLGDVARALPFLERALAIQEAAVGPDHPALALPLTHLGQALYQQGEYAKAWALFERELRIVERAQGADSTAAAATHGNLGNVRLAQGKFDEALAQFTRSLEIRQRTLAPEHPDLAVSLHNLGEVHRRRGDVDEARGYFERALALREKVLGPEHPHVAGSLLDVARVLQGPERTAKARAYLERALAIREGALGPRHPDVASVLTTLGIIVDEHGERELARAHFERAVAIREAALGPEHLDLASPLNNLGDLLGSQGKYAEARPYFERALRVLERKLGANHGRLAPPLHNLGELHRFEGDCRGALPYYARALALWEASLRPGHPNLAHPLTGLGRCQLELGAVTAALPLLERALALRTTNPESPQLVAETEVALARALHAAGRRGARVEQLVRAARARLVTAGATKELAELDRWRKTRR